MSELPTQPQAFLVLRGRDNVFYEHKQQQQFYYHHHISIMNIVESNLKTNMWTCTFFLHYLWHLFKNNKSSSKNCHSTIDQSSKIHLTYIKIYCSCIISDVQAEKSDFTSQGFGTVGETGL